MHVEPARAPSSPSPTHRHAFASLKQPARRRRDQRGAAAVEFALIVPLLLLLLFGTIQYGLYFWALQGGNDIARDAARLSAVGAPADCASLRATLGQKVESLTGYGESVTVRRTYHDAPPMGVNVGDTVEVELAFRGVDLRLPFVPFIDAETITSRVVTRVESVPLAPEPCLL